MPPYAVADCGTLWAAMAPSAHNLAEVFAAAGGITSDLSAEELEQALEILLAEGQRLWAVTVSPDAFARHVAHVMGEDATVTELHPDVLLASAALAGDRRAIELVDEMVRASAARATLPGAPADEIAQQVREQLLVGTGEAATPKLSQYSGRGPLGAWLRVLVTRAGLTARRTESRRTAKHSRDDDLAELASGESTPELQMLRSAYAVPFRDAFGEALATLPPEDRNLLRLHLVDGLSIDRLGVLHGIHRATAARRLTRLRSQILSKTRELLLQRLRISQSDFSSLVGLMLSRIEVSTSFLDTR